MTVPSELPERPPFTLRARLLTPLGDGRTRYEEDALIAVDDRGRLASVERGHASEPDAMVDIRPWVVMPGLVSTCMPTCRSCPTPGWAPGCIS